MENKCSDAEHFLLCSVLLCSSALLLCFCSDFRLLLLPFFYYFISSNVPSALPSVCSALVLSTLPSFLSLLCTSCSALCSARWGCLPFFRKTQISFPPSKNSRHFFKNFTLPIYI